MNKLIGFLMLLLSTSAFAQECQTALTTAYNCAVNGGFGTFEFSWSALAGFASVFLMASAVFLRLFAEVLGWIANKTKNTWDNKLVHFLMDVVNFIGKIIGWFGGGTPRLVK